MVSCPCEARSLWTYVSFEDVRFLQVRNHSCLPVCAEENENLIVSYVLRNTARNYNSTIVIGHHRVTRCVQSDEVHRFHGF